jgi:antitoxin (DNA-binding transcriptional repressor) of toxin-antitoxin stability system
MAVVTTHAAKTTLSRLLARVEAGEEIVLARGDKPVARLVPIEALSSRRQFGAMRGQIDIDARFFDQLPEEELNRWGV